VHGRRLSENGPGAASADRADASATAADPTTAPKSDPSQGPDPEARIPSSSGVGSGGTEPNVPDHGWSDTDRILAELDRVDAELKPRRPGVSGSAAAPATAPHTEPATTTASTDYSEEPAPLDAKYSPYLEEHLGLATASLVELGAGLRAMDDRWRELREAAIRLEQQMEGAAQEVEFLRQHAGAVPMGTIPRGPLVSASETLAARAASHGLAVDAPFGEFTAERYGRTVASVRQRRRSMAGWTIGLAALISGALLTFTYLAHEAAPPIWLAVLPLVWLIPVPFFVVSFLATQRLVAQNALDLAGSS
jgi:hypothetical protein